jgi:hypothetical protein
MSLRRYVPLRSKPRYDPDLRWVRGTGGGLPDAVLRPARDGPRSGLGCPVIEKPDGSRQLRDAVRQLSPLQDRSWAGSSPLAP